MTLKDELIQYRDEFDDADMRAEFDIRVLGPVNAEVERLEKIKNAK